MAARKLIESDFARIVRWLLFPDRFFKGISFFSKLRAPHGMSCPAVLSNAWQCARVNLDAFTWWSYGFNKQANFERLNDYLFHEEIVSILETLNSRVDVEFLDNKLCFFNFCLNHSIPCANILEHLSSSLSHVTLREKPIRLPEDDLFLKFDDGVCGNGAEKWIWNANSGLWVRNGIKFNLREMRNYLEAKSGSGRLLIQASLQNHPLLARYSNGSLATLRVVTCRKRNQAPKILTCCLRMPCGNSEVDNFAAGGLAAGVSLNGVIGTGSRKVDGPLVYKCHPDTGHRFEGEILPMFDAAIALCLGSHEMFQEPHFVGWDVAFLENGPILLEANTVWCVNLIQQGHRLPIGEFGFFDDFLDCLRASEA